MARRVSVPAADELFRPTQNASGEPVVRAVPDVTEASAGAETQAPGRAQRRPAAARRSSGRVRHDEKMTVYVTSGELLEIEQARLALRSVHGLAVDRGRIVREAVSLVLADLEERGEDSALIRRLTSE
ncbi:hypothetical protein IEQ44_06255 [Nocardioides sp. Y6]|uniref:Cobyrinic acid a,c-diamide synthase n=1 Tax=Nocardioides malaquae TaxID=2773426 RepID=A0ABR9RRR4_9ACTN|nr:hypothetical protein [Nocardioides malaquae]MBE7324249.1 hypothetical protein [Nocardioides malaquae]